MHSAAEIAKFIVRLKAEVPDISVWIYSGFEYEEICADDNMRSLLLLCDVLVDGEFVLEQRDTTLPYRGSRNQRVIDIKKSNESERVVIWNEHGSLY